jgi:hypothetical protein
MDSATFIIALLITLGVLVFVRMFWQEILIIGYVLYLIGTILFISLMSTLLWVIFISANSQGWGWMFLYFNIAYTGLLVLYVLIINDIFQMAVNILMGSFKRSSEN